ncbi:hypothetical protein DV736_g3285, partial [Chaetothyriales sp. CBS 134916]
MKSFVISTLMLLASLTGASPIPAAPLTDLGKRTEDIDVTILQFALTLEHLENVFYKTALVQFSASDFETFGLPSSYFSELLFIAIDEQSHVDLLTTAIIATGSSPVAPCTYNFPFTDVQSFLTLSSVLEGVGTSAYLGAAPLVTDKTILTTAASIMVTEALHTSQQRGVVQQVPASNPFGTPLSASAAFTLAASFISLFITFISGLTVVSVAPLSASDTSGNNPSLTAVIPTALEGGQTYIFVTNKDISGGTLVDQDIVMGPGITEIAPATPSVDSEAVVKRSELVVGVSRP